VLVGGGWCPEAVKNRSDCRADRYADTPCQPYIDHWLEQEQSERADGGGGNHYYYES